MPVSFMPISTLRTSVLDIITIGLTITQ